MRYVLFHNGRVIDGVVRDNIISMAKRGLITDVGRSCYLVPDTRFGERDVNGLREMGNGQVVGRRKFPRLRESDCIPLLNLVPSHLKAA